MVVTDQPLRWSCSTARPSSFGEGLEVLVVVAALAGGVLDAAGVGQGVGGFVQQGAEDLAGGAAQSFAADHDFGVLLAVRRSTGRGRGGPSGGACRRCRWR